MFATHKHRRKHSVCPNCNHLLHPEDNYCPNCGQENHDLKIPLGHLLYEFVESITHFDTKLWETSKAIFTRPGKITKDFLDGKRARYVPPARMYVFVSFVFFLLLNTVFDRSIQEGKTIDFRSVDVRVDSTTYNVNRNDILAYQYMTEAQQDSLLSTFAPTADSTQRQKLSAMIAQLDSTSGDESGNLLVDITGDSTLQTPKDVQKFSTMTDEELGAYLKAHGSSDNFLYRRLLKQSPKYAFQFNVKEFVRKVLKSLSVVMFILMPVVALLLLALYRKKHYYYEHLIFSVHFHTIVFIAYTIAILLDSLVGKDYFLVLTTLLLFFYLYKSMRRVYGQSRTKTLAKYFLLTSAYGLVALLCLAGVLFYSFLYF
ncbi:DUF3667 domain-containing protein [Telluribacter humicola]|uniref:DUF3667 domain-containing protein n=1 Tax=Telluribacter humicola TaxID=1720261 RepID=UPI001A96CCD8|nr:DUF3667 domain-containing protein [Telluribacter humicola]